MMLLLLRWALQCRNAVRCRRGVYALPNNTLIPLANISLIVFLCDNVLLPAVVDQLRFRQLRLLNQKGLFAVHESYDEIEAWLIPTILPR